MMKARRPRPPKVIFTSFRMSDVLDHALSLYMRDRHLENKTEIISSLLGALLEREGYLVKTKNGWEVHDPSP